MTTDVADLVFIRELVRKESAIVLDESKQYLIESRLRPLAKEKGLASISELVEQIKRGSRDLRVGLVEAMTTNETSFFRDARPFESLTSHVIPALSAARGAKRSLRIWSAASSTGQEAYSIAMTLHEHPAVSGWKYDILGTDLSTAVLAQARAGRYAQLEVNRGLPAAKLVRWFDRDGLGWVVKRDLKASVRFEQLNLLSSFPVSYSQFDIIFLRNVLIYFDVPTKRDILTKMKRALAPDGYLMLGTAEMMNGVYDGFRAERDGATTWHRPS